LLFQFANFLIDTDRRELKGSGGVIHVEPQVFDLLVHLVQNTNRVISKDELIDKVWKGRAVSDAALNSRITSARRAIGDNGQEQTIIRTIQRRGFLFAAEVASSDRAMGAAEPAPKLVSTADKPSIAVLPFQNLSGDATQDYFADGVVEDIITGLSRIKWLLAIARNSSFAFRGQSIDIKRIGRELGARYVLEGSVRKADERIRVNALLVDAETGAHLWADRYDRRLADVFALQDEITLSVIGAIEPSLRDAEIERVRRKRPDSLDAYDLVLRAIPHTYVATPEEAIKALPFLQMALALESDYAGAHGLVAWCHQILFMRAGYREEDRAAAIRHGRTALACSRDDATALALGAFVTGLVEHDRETAAEAFERALAFSPSSAFALFMGCIVFAYIGDSERAINWAERALRVSPIDRLAYIPHHAIAIGHFMNGQYEEAVVSVRRAVQCNPTLSVTQSWLVAILVKLGRINEAKAVAKRVAELQPSFSSSRFCTAIGTLPAVTDVLTDAWREAGLAP